MKNKKFLIFPLVLSMIMSAAFSGCSILESFMGQNSTVQNSSQSTQSNSAKPNQNSSVNDEAQGGNEDNQGGNEDNQGGNEDNQGGNEDNQGGNEDNQGGNEGNQGGNVETFKYDSYLIKHAENESVTYKFEAECTDLGNKTGPAWSGNYSEAGMITQAEGASGGYAVQGLAAYGNNVYFLVVSDRDVNDATLVLQLGNVTKYDVTLTSTNYAIRVDTIVTDEDLLPAKDGGAIGNWDEFFFGYYGDLATTGGYYIESWECGDITFEAPNPFTAGNVYMGDSNGYTITTSLNLKKGVNCIALFTANNDMMVGTTMSATAPAVDCIEIKTTAQLGMYYSYDNGGYGVTPCKIK